MLSTQQLYDSQFRRSEPKNVLKLTAQWPKKQLASLPLLGSCWQ